MGPFMVKSCKTFSTLFFSTGVVANTWSQYSMRLSSLNHMSHKMNQTEENWAKWKKKVRKEKKIEKATALVLWLALFLWRRHQDWQFPPAIQRAAQTPVMLALSTRAILNETAPVELDCQLFHNWRGVRGKKGPFVRKC